MNTSDLLWKKWKEMIHCMEMELKAQAELIDAQKGQICSLENKIKILEEQKKRLTDAGNGLAEESEKLEKICVSQQELLDEFRTISAGTEKKKDSQQPGKNNSCSS